MAELTKLLAEANIAPYEGLGTKPTLGGLLSQLGLSTIEPTTPAEVSTALGQLRNAITDALSRSRDLESRVAAQATALAEHETKVAVVALESDKATASHSQVRDL